MRPRAAVLVALAAIALAETSTAQRGDPHGIKLPFMQVRPLDARVAEADAAAVGTVEQVGIGRVRIRAAVAAFGDVPAEFELKRAPSTPPGLVRGERVVLLLRGARSPYLLVDDASEIARAPGSGGEARWTAAVRETRAAGDDADAVLTLALSWLEAPERALRQAALRVLVAHEGSVPSRAADLAGGAARAARDDAIDWDARMVAATVAARHAGTRRALLEALPGSVDARVIQSALRTSLPFGEPVARAALLRSLRHEDRDVRLAALGAVGAASSEEVLAETERLAREDPDEAVRTSAQRSLERSGVGGSAAERRAESAAR